MAWKELVVAAGLSTSALAGSIWCWPFGHDANELKLPGTVEIQETRLASKVGGRVVSVLVDENDVVEPGQTLIELDQAELQARRAQLIAERDVEQALLDKARAGARPEEHEAQQAAVRAAEATLARLVSGFRVEDREEAQGELKAWEGQLVETRRERERQLSLKLRGINAQADLDLAESRYQQMAGQVRAAKARADKLEAGTRAEEIAEARAALDRAQAQWRLMQAGTRTEEIAEAEARVRTRDAQLAELDVQIREATVCAPVKAAIEVIGVRVGDVVAANQPVVRVLHMDDLYVKAYVPETQLGHVKRGTAVRVTVDSHPGREFPGEVLSIASASEFTPRNVQSVDERRHQVFAVKVRVRDDEGIFKSGMAAEVIVAKSGEGTGARGE